MYHDYDILDTTWTIEISVNDNKEIPFPIKELNLVKRELKFQLSRETICHREHENITSMISGKTLYSSIW